MNLLNTAYVKYETQILENGRVISRRPEKRNLLLDTGLDGFAVRSFWESFSHCVLGNGTTPTKRDSGAITVSITSEVATASANYFEAADVGRLLKLDSGQEVYIDGYTSGTEVSVTGADDAAASEATIWYVNESGHGNELVRTSNLGTDSGDVSNSWDGNEVEHKRTFIFPVEESARTYKEIGWSHTNNAGNNLLGRDLIPNGGDSISPGQQYKVIVKLYIALSPLTQTAVASVGSGGWDTAGTVMLYSLHETFLGKEDDGGLFLDNRGRLEPSFNKFLYLSKAVDALPTSPVTTIQAVPAGALKLSLTPDAYTPGSFQKTFRRTLSTSEGNDEWTEIGMHGDSNSRLLYLRLDTPQTKDSDHTLDIAFTISWGRTLTN